MDIYNNRWLPFRQLENLIILTAAITDVKYSTITTTLTTYTFIQEEWWKHWQMTMTIKTCHWLTWLGVDNHDLVVVRLLISIHKTWFCRRCVDEATLSIFECYTATATDIQTFCATLHDAPAHGLLKHCRRIQTRAQYERDITIAPSVTLGGSKDDKDQSYLEQTRHLCTWQFEGFV